MNNENITSHGISSRKRNYYLTILNNSKELMSSYCGEEQFEIVRMHFSKNNIFSNYVSFYGNIESENETRYISGKIYDFYRQVYIIDGCVIRENVSVDDNKIIDFNEGFSIRDTDDIIRVTRYGDIQSLLKINRDEFYNKKDSAIMLVRRS